MRALPTALHCTRQQFKTDFGFPYVPHKKMKRNCRVHTPLIAADVSPIALRSSPISFSHLGEVAGPGGAMMGSLGSLCYLWSD